MQIGRFFALGAGRVGQFLSPRVLIVRWPFRPKVPTQTTQEFCCFGFNTVRQAQPFIQSLSRLGLWFELQQSQMLSAFPYEVVVWGETEFACTLAFWDRHDAKQMSQRDNRRPFQPVPKLPTLRSNFRDLSSDSTPAIAA